MDATWHYIPKVLVAGQLKDACEKAIAATLGDELEHFHVEYPRRDGRPGVREDDLVLDVGSLQAIVDMSKIDLKIDAQSSYTKGNARRVWITFRAMDSLVTAYAYGTPAVNCLEQIALSLGLERTEPPEDVTWDNVLTRVEALEHSVAQIRKRLKCFISFRFNDAQTVEQINVLKRMLKALEIDWITGEEFEPRKIEEKVRARLRADVDFLIGVINKAGQSNWIRDELGDAHARELRIILLKEDGAIFDEGIFGPLEFIPYKDAISQTFPALVEGINFIRAEIAERSQNTKVAD